MAIHLITGVPGAGKSLRAVWTCVKRISSEKEQDRPVFGNVRGFRRQAPLPGSNYQDAQGQFQELDGEWMDCPDGSIIMIDEVQERWRRYRSTGEPPPEIAALERHRHRNIDFILTCQNPKQLSDDVRSLVDCHEHLTKKGKGAATVYRWNGRCSTSPYTNRRDPDCEIDPIWRYPKWVFDEFVSANEHTVRNKTPRIFKVAAMVALAIPTSLYFAYSQITSVLEESHANESPALVDPVADANPSPSTPTLPAPTPEPAPEIVTAHAAALMGDRCSLYDSDGRHLVVSRPECLRALDSGMPVDVEILRFRF